MCIRDRFETDKEDLDITSAEEVTLFGLRNRPNTIINCAGLTDTELCERNVEEAYKVNALGARNLSAVDVYKRQVLSRGHQRQISAQPADGGCARVEMCIRDRVKTR